MDLINRFQEVDYRISETTRNFIGILTLNGDQINFNLLCEHINGISHRTSSFNYHIDLIKREIYDENDKILERCREKKILLIAQSFDQEREKIMRLIMHRSTFLLRDIIADFFGCLDNLAKVVTVCNKNADGKRISSVIKSLNHEHIKNKPFAIYLNEQWENWVKELYDGYRKDAIHFNPENCKVSNTFSWTKIDNVPISVGEGSEKIEIRLPNKIMEKMNYSSEVDLINFCFNLQDRLISLIENTLINLSKEFQPKNQ